MTQRWRNHEGGLIDRSRPIHFTFNGRRYGGFAGDTLASALLANGVRIVGRSFKYHRPRGVFALGVEEPNALVQLGIGARSEPNTKATQIELADGMVAASQNCWPGVGFDLGAMTGLFSRLLPAGFYYKTFKWPSGGWLAYERFIRRMAGMGVCATAPDPDRYEHSHVHCDVLVVGGGPAGLAAAQGAGRTGARVLLVDEGSRLGGTLLHDGTSVEGMPGRDWIERIEADLSRLPEVTILRRATAFGYYDHNQLGVVERVADHRAPRPGEPRQRIWHVQAREVVLATGAHERALVFGNNDLPGVMLASAARGYVNAFAVRPGREAVVLTNNDSAYAVARDLAAGGVSVRAVVDLRGAPSGSATRQATAAGAEVVPGSAVVHAHGGRAVTGVTISAIDDSGRPCGSSRNLACDLICVSGGWSPAVHLHAQARGKPRFDRGIGGFVPGLPVQAERSVGAARGSYALEACIAEGTSAGIEAAGRAGFRADARHHPPGNPATIAAATAAVAPPALPLFSIGALSGSRYKRFVDLQNDVTEADIHLAVREGYRSVEHVKRYTTLGMGTDQGKTSNIAGFAQIAAANGVDIEAVGTTTFRPPYVPVTLGALAGSESGAHFLANRRTAMHDEHVAAGAVMLQSGPWLRPQCYPRAGESLDDAARREARSVRSGVGLVDVSTLGKFEVAGPDAATFLERLYVNRLHTLNVGRCRYGVMLRDDGIVFDDGTVTRLSDHHYFLTTTTAQALLLARRLDHCHKVLWPQLDLNLVNVTEQWAAVALAGPRAGEVIARIVDSGEVDDAGLPHMGHARVRIGGVAARILRISFSGERAYEIYVPAQYGAALWCRLLDIGQDCGIAAYGIDALNTLRIEKGHVAGAELDGRVTADDLGLGRMVKPDGEFIGRRGALRPGLRDSSRWQLVGLAPADGKTSIPPGAKIVDSTPGRYQGEVTSTTWSPVLQMPIALALVSAGRSRHGQALDATSPLAGRRVAVIVRSPVFVDPEGTRLHG